MPKAVQIVATESDSGKTQIISGLMYIFRHLKPFPFKGQNMSLNSYVGSDNGEMAFAQAYQSMVANVTPNSISNPVLLKPVQRGRTEVIFRGKSIGIFSAKDYWFRIKNDLKEKVFSIFQEVLSKENLVFVEGAGSCAEVNLKDNDFANLKLSTKFNLPFILVSDIEKGGVFAKIIGSYELMNKKEKELLLGIIINKMSGEKDLLKDGIDYIQKKTKKKVIGIIPYSENLLLPEEDSLGFTRSKFKKKVGSAKKISIKVIKLRYMSNFFDFYPLEVDSKYNEGIEFSYARIPEELDGSDVIIIPGSRNVFFDLKFLNDSGFSQKILKLVKRGKILIGICGGYEMFFRRIQDQFGIEFPRYQTVVEGFGFIEDTLRFHIHKKVGWEKIYIKSPWFSGNVLGFNIRHGSNDLVYFSKDNVFGTFLHNIFWNDKFRESLYRYLGVDYKSKFVDNFKKETKNWSNLLKDNLDIDFIERNLRFS